MTKVLCVYHGPGCADGLASAWAVHRALGDGVEFVAAQYGDTPPGYKKHVIADLAGATVTRPTGEMAGRDVLIVDFSYPRATLEALAREARSVLVLDHHKTAQEDLIGLAKINPKGPGYLDCLAHLDHPGRINLAAIFDMDRSGAGITWDYLVGGPRSPLIDLVEDRDLWRFKLADSRAFHAVLTSYDIGDLPAMLKLLDNWHAYTNDHLIPSRWPFVLMEGNAILRAQGER